MTETAIYAAGGVVWRLVEGKLTVLLIHRTAYRDLTLPKGKVDPGETLAETAVREIFEETGIHVSLGIPVGVSRYRMPNKREKIVHYWSAEATDVAIRTSAFVPNREIAAIEWMTPKKALKRLSYPVDVEILENFMRFVDDGVLATFPLIVLRHAKALSREEWKGKDAARPLSHRGRKQANADGRAAPRLRPAEDRLIARDALHEDRQSAVVGDRPPDRPDQSPQPGRVGRRHVGCPTRRGRSGAGSEVHRAVQSRAGAPRDPE